jgi:hypothetical protein
VLARGLNANCLNSRFSRELFAKWPQRTDVHTYHRIAALLIEISKSLRGLLFVFGPWTLLVHTNNHRPPPHPLPLQASGKSLLVSCLPTLAASLGATLFPIGRWWILLRPLLASQQSIQVKAYASLDHKMDIIFLPLSSFGVCLEDIVPVHASWWARQKQQCGHGCPTNDA